METLGFDPSSSPNRGKRASQSPPRVLTHKWGRGGDGGQFRSAGQSCLRPLCALSVLVFEIPSPCITWNVFSALSWNKHSCVRVILYFTDMLIWLIFSKHFLLFCSFLIWEPVTLSFQKPNILKAFENRGDPRHGGPLGPERPVAGPGVLLPLAPGARRPNTRQCPG